MYVHVDLWKCVRECSFNLFLKRHWNKIKSGVTQRTKKVVSDSQGLRKVDSAIRLVNSVFNLPDGQVMLFE